jgi:hypothetical protein
VTGLGTSGNPYKIGDGTGTFSIGTLSATGGTIGSITLVMPDATTSQETAINAALTAIAATGGGIVQLGEGTYTIDGPILVPSNCTLQGVGDATLIYLADGSDCRAIQNSDTFTGGTINDVQQQNITVRNLKVNWNRYGNAVSTEETTRYLSNSVYFNYVDNLLIEGVHVVEGGYVGIGAEFSSNVTIKNCRVDFTSAGGIGVFHATTLAVISGCIVNNAGYQERFYYDAGATAFTVGETITGGTSGATAVVVTVPAPTTGSWAGDDAAGYITVINQHYNFKDDDVIAGSTGGAAMAVKAGYERLYTAASYGESAIQEGSGIKAQDGCSNVTISNNIVNNPIKYAYAAYSHTGEGNDNYISINGNIAKDYYAAVRIGGLQSTSNIQVSNNILTNTCAVDTSYATFVLQGPDLNNISITGNIIYANGDTILACLVASQTIDNLVYTGNTSYQAGSTTNLGYECVKFSAGTSYNKINISGNVFDGLYQSGGINFNDTGDTALVIEDVLIANNIFAGFSNTSSAVEYMLKLDSDTVYKNCVAYGNTFNGASPTDNKQVFINVTDTSGESLPYGWRLQEPKNFKTSKKIQTDSPVTISANTANYTATTHNNGTTATSVVTFNLPASAPGMEVSFYVTDDAGIIVDPNGAETISYTDCAAGDYITSTTLGSYVRLKCYVAGTWVPFPIYGTWDDEEA